MSAQLKQPTLLVNDSLKILAEVEDLFFPSPKNFIIKFLYKTFMHPFLIVIIDPFINKLKFFCIYFSLFIMGLILYIILPIPMQNKIHEFQSLIYLFAFFIFVIRGPSQYLYANIDVQLIIKSTHVIKKNAITSTEQLKILVDIFSKHQEIFNTRLTRIKWILTSSWIGFTFYFSTSNGIINKLPSDKIQEFIISQFKVFGVYFLILVSLILLFYFYQKATEHIFQAIQFAIHELKNESNTSLNNK
jgi:hypothetical protein